MQARARGRGPLAPVLAGLLLSLSSRDRAASAQIDGGSLSTPQASTRTLDVTLVEAGDDAGLLMDTIRELVGRLGLGVVPHRVSAADARADAGPQPPGLSVWIDLGSRYDVLTVVHNGPTEVRRTIPRDASPAIVREEIGEAVRSAVESQLLADESPSAPPPASALDASAAPVPPSIVAESLDAQAPPSHGLAVDVTTVAGAGGIADRSGLVPHVGGGLVVASRRRWRPSVSLTAEYVLPFDTILGSVTANASIVSLRAVPAIEVVHGSWIAVDVGAGGGVDVITVTPSIAPGTPQMLTASGDVPTQVDPVLTTRATAYLALAPGVALTVVAGSDLDLALASLHYAAPNGDVFAPWRVRPVVLAGFTFTAAGSGLFAARTP
jgi:hypothetical protein